MKEGNLQLYLETGKVLGRILSSVTPVPGQSLRSLSDQIMARLPLDYSPGTGDLKFPAPMCISKSQTICHGIPDQRLVEEEDLIKVDIILKHKGRYVDSCGTFCVGRNFEDFHRRSYLCFSMIVRVLRLTKRLKFLAYYSQRVAQILDLGIVREFCGHGIGDKAHMEPWVCLSPENFDLYQEFTNFNAFTIEPIFFDLRRQRNYKIRSRLKHEFFDSQGGNFVMFEHTLIFTDRELHVVTYSELDERGGKIKPAYLCDSAGLRSWFN